MKADEGRMRDRDGVVLYGVTGLADWIWNMPTDSGCITALCARLFLLTFFESHDVVYKKKMKRQQYLPHEYALLLEGHFSPHC